MSRVKYLLYISNIIKRATNTTGINEYGSTVKDFLQTSFNRVSEAGTYFNNTMLHIDTNRGGGATGGVVGIAFSPGWQGHQNQRHRS